jgi:drug/metabolite transporter (DMT)-like permease
MKNILKSRQTGIIAAFAAVYILWGSTYLGIKYAIETIPPFVMAGARFLIAGGILLSWAVATGAKMPKIAEYKNILLVSILLLVIGNGGVVLAEKHISTGMTALMITIEPVWVVLIQWANGKKPNLKIWTGIILGFIGMFILIGPAGVGGLEQTNTTGVILVMVSTFAWAGGSIFSSNRSTETSPILTTGLQMIFAGFIFSMGSMLTGEFSSFDISTVTSTSYIAFVYLIVCGSLIGFTCYIWLLKVASPGRVSTYAYVNPAIAVFLGVLIAGEALNYQILFALPVLVLAVVLILMQKNAPASTLEPAGEVKELCA